MATNEDGESTEAGSEGTEQESEPVAEDAAAPQEEALPTWSAPDDASPPEAPAAPVEAPAAAPPPYVPPAPAPEQAPPNAPPQAPPSPGADQGWSAPTDTQQPTAPESPMGYEQQAPAQAAPAWGQEGQQPQQPQQWAQPQQDQPTQQQWAQPAPAQAQPGAAPPPQSWTVPGTPPTAQQPVVGGGVPPVVGQPLGQPQAQPGQPYGAQAYGAQPAPAGGPTKGGGPLALLGGLLLFVGGVLLIVGSFLDWGEGLVNGTVVTLTGFENAQGDLWGAPGTIAAGVVLVLVSVMYLVSMKKGVGGITRSLALLGSLVGLGWVVYLLVTLQLDEANALIGLWICLAGGILGLLGTFLGRGKKAAAKPKG